MFVIAQYLPYHWVILIGLLTAGLLLIWRVTSHYAEPKSRHILATMTINVTILCALTSILLIPIDIFTTANDIHVISIERTYAMVYLTMAVFICAFVPFAFFYVEETDAGEEDCMTKSTAAAKSTFVILLILTLVLGAILVIGERESTHVTTQEAAKTWMNALVDEHARLERMYKALLYVMAACTAVGFINLIFYGGFGLGSFPVVLLRGQLAADEEKLELEFSKLKLKKERQTWEKKATRSNKARESLKMIDSKIKIMDRRMHKLDKQASSSFYSYIYMIIAPFRVGIGLGLLITSLLVVGTIGVVCIDRFVHSACGFDCGYLLDSSDATFPNVIDIIMVEASEFFPVDYIVFITIGLYLFLACGHGIGRLGIRVMGFEVFKIRKGKTSPQGLLVSTVILGMCALAISVTLLSIAPQYVSFGAQSYDADGVRKACDLKDTVGDDAKCRLTNFARFVGTQTMSNRLFSLAFFYGQVVFVGISMVSLLHAFCRRRDGLYDESDDVFDDEDGDDMEVLGEELRSWDDGRT